MLVLGLVEVPWWGLILLTIVAYLLFASRNFNYFKKQGIAGPTPIPIFGTTIYAMGKVMPEMDMAMIKRHADKGVCGEFFGGVPSLVVFNEKLLSDIMVKEFTSFSNHVSFAGKGTVTEKMLGNLQDEHWKHVRSEMTPTFTTGKLKKMNSEVNRCAKTLTDNLLERARLHEVVEMKEYTGGFAMDAIASTAFGIRVDSQKDRNNAFVTYAKKAFDDFSPLNPMLFARIFFPEICSILMKLGLSMEPVSKDILDFFSNITEQTIRMRKSENDQSKADFIQLMINKEREDGDDADVSSATPGLTTEEIVGNSVVFFVAGYDTTASSLSFFFYNLAVNQDCQDKLVEEIQRVVGDNDPVDYSLLQDMPYLDQCINETLRINPPVSRINRVVTKEITINGIYFRKGTVVEIPIHAIHHDPKRWPNPDKFDPERFTAENKKGRSPYSFLTFGGGPRNCIGMRLALMELKMAAIHVLRNVKVTTCEKTKVPVKYAKDSFILKVDGGLWLRVEPRD